ncbi:RNA-binding domain-containing protein [Alicyclobacillus sp. SO9]|uniref:RNA-binding domain-containing protein n=1 Tax=Alicyclobacillus sp. SO9 TaxID=2665646 RepID=UPI0018E70A9C|nr:RNA-binding domain-containing protein [Alicyclobacillus sp. SO9]QQE80435.1 putative DNA binding domain-containing protein [Alicyclobacillus sp. SO9]
MDLEEMVYFENEYTKLDFKKMQYRKDQYENLIKDLIAMANADVEGCRYIIIGVKHHAAGTREFSPIDAGDFVDDATYQQLISDNVEPGLPFRYFPLELNDRLFGVFEIDAAVDPPYLMKKDYGKLRRGQSWVRYGSSQRCISRPDLDRMYLTKMDSPMGVGTLSTFDQELRWASGANSNGAYFSVMVNYGVEYGELTSDRKWDLLKFARKITEDLGYSPDDAFRNSTSEVVEYWAPSNDSSFHLKYHHPGVLWLQFRQEGDVISLEWLIDMYCYVYNWIHSEPNLKTLTATQLGLALVHWPANGVDLFPLLPFYESLRKGHLTGARLIEKTSISDKQSWGDFFKVALEKCLTENGYIGHEDGIRSLEFNF